MSTKTVFRAFNRMTWPAPGEVMSNMAWRLRYAPESVSDADKLQIASILDAYADLIRRPVRERADLIRELRLGPNLPPAAYAKAKE